MNVVMVTTMYPTAEQPSLGAFVRSQACELPETVEVTTIVGRIGGTVFPMKSSEPVIEVGLPWFGASSKLSILVDALVLARRLVHIVRRMPQKPDLLHGHFALPAGVATVLAARVLGLPSVVTLHGSDFNIQLQRFIVGGMVGRFLATASAVVGVSEAISSGFANRYGVGGRADRVFHVPNGYHADRFWYDAASFVSGDLLFVGALRDVKGLDTLLKALSLMGDGGPAVDLVGSGPLESQLRAQADELGVSSLVRWSGSVANNQLRGWYSRAGALVLPSQSEGMPLVVLESLACGTPVIASSVGAIPDLIVPGVNGYLVPSGDADSLAAAISDGLSHEWNRAQIASDAQRWSWSRSAEGLLQVYRYVMQGGSLS